MLSQIKGRFFSVRVRVRVVSGFAIVEKSLIDCYPRAANHMSEIFHF